jgi:hypothetical protein
MKTEKLYSAVYYSSLGESRTEHLELKLEKSFEFCHLEVSS